MESKICLNCNNKFIPNYRITQKFCNKDCSFKYWVKNNQDKVFNIKDKYYKNNRTKIISKSRLLSKLNPEKSNEYKLKYYKNHKREIIFRNNIYKISNPEKYKAKMLAQYWIKLKQNCEICNSTNNLQRHHWRYDKPLLVNTLCIDCHKVQHGAKT